MIHPSGTFEYVAVVPTHAEGEPFRSDCRSRAAAGERRLVGANPKVLFEPAGLTPDAGPNRPFVMRTRVTLRARLLERTHVPSFSFHVDQSLIDRLDAGDLLHLARTGTGGLGMSAIRGNELVYAVGAVTSVPLGDVIRIGTPHEIIAQAEALFKRRDADFYFRELPVEVRAGGTTLILFTGRRQVGDYKVFVSHGHLVGIPPGVDACVAVTRTGWCPEEAAIASAMLLAGGRTRDEL
jgi:hypothetical protein